MIHKDLTVLHKHGLAAMSELKTLRTPGIVQFTGTCRHLVSGHRMTLILTHLNPRSVNGREMSIKASWLRANFVIKIGSVYLNSAFYNTIVSRCFTESETQRQNPQVSTVARKNSILTGRNLE